MDKSNSNWLFVLLFQTRFQDMVSVNVNPSTGWFLIWIRVLTITEVSISSKLTRVVIIQNFHTIQRLWVMAFFKICFCSGVCICFTSVERSAVAVATPLLFVWQLS